MKMSRLLRLDTLVCEWIDVSIYATEDFLELPLAFICIFMFVPLEEGAERIASSKFTVISIDTCRGAGRSYLMLSPLRAFLRLVSLMAAQDIGFALQLEEVTFISAPVPVPGPAADALLAK